MGLSRYRQPVVLVDSRRPQNIGGTTREQTPAATNLHSTPSNNRKAGSHAYDSTPAPNGD